MTATKENVQMRVFSALGIIMILCGHLAFNVLEMGGLFPYYSFHVFIFLFISGYFYKPDAEQHILHYIKKKAIHLLLPYFIWNLFYGVLATLLHNVGFSIGQELSLKTLLLSPFLDGHQFLYNYPAWFVPALFLIEVINVSMRRVLSLIHLNNEWLIFSVCLILGIVTVWLAIGGHVWGYYKFPGRLLFMFPGFLMGRLYKEKLEVHDTLPSSIYFTIVMTVQVILTSCCGGLAFSAVWCTGFANAPYIPYLSAVTGIAFWLRMSKIISKLPTVAGKLAIIGRNTYAIMLHHISGFVIIKSCFYFLNKYTPLFNEFDSEMFFTEINFTYLPGGNEGIKWIYLAAGIALPLLLVKMQNKITFYISSRH